MMLLILLHVGFIGLMARSIRLSVPAELKKWFWPALMIKLIAGLLLGYIYTYHYPESDTLFFFKEASALANQAHGDFTVFIRNLWEDATPFYSGESRTLFIVKVVSFFALITNQNYWVTSLYFSFISFCAAWWLVRTVSQFFPAITFPAIVGFLFFPSAVFWSSGVTKESLAMAGLFMLSGIFIRLWNKQSNSTVNWLTSILALWVAWKLKYFYVAVWLSAATTALLTRWLVENKMRVHARTAYRESVLYLVMLMVMLFVATFIHPNFYPQQLMDVVVDNYRIYMENSLPGSTTQYHNLQPTLGSMLINAPWALVSGLFRPFIWEAANIFQFMAGIENMLLFMMVLLALKKLPAAFNSTQRLLILAVLVYIIMLCILLALSTPNFGTLVRYRVGFMPFLVMLLMYRLLPGRIEDRLMKTV